jgi:glutamate synthase domain-containing protein 2
MALKLTSAEFEVVRDKERCISCFACARQCAFDTHTDNDGVVESDSRLCVGCHRCEVLCPTGALKIVQKERLVKENSNWQSGAVLSIQKQSETGGVVLSAMGTDRPYTLYWDHLLLNAAQVTNPSIDPLREPMELRTYLGRKPVSFQEGEELSPQLCLEMPVLFSAMSYGSISLNACRSLAWAARAAGTYWNTGEGGLPKELYAYSDRTICQVASGRFGVSPEYLDQAAALEIKIGQGAKPGIGGHLPGEKVTAEISATRMIPEGTDAISPAPHHDIYSIEDLKQLIFALKEATGYRKPVAVKIAAVHNVAAIASGAVRAGADIVCIDGIRGGTGAAPMVIRDNVGIPIELALAAVDDRLRQEGIRPQASIVVAGSIRSSADVVKAIALGADAVYIGTAALVALGCHVCQKCYTGKCNWGIATQDPYLTKRLNPEVGARRLTNLLRAWNMEIKEMLGGMGINALESLRGNREQLRAVGLTDKEMEILGVKHAGEGW